MTTKYDPTAYARATALYVRACQTGDPADVAAYNAAMDECERPSREQAARRSSSVGLCENRERAAVEGGAA